MSKEKLKPIVMYISDEERRLLDAMVKVSNILHPFSKEVTRTSLARSILQAHLATQKDLPMELAGVVHVVGAFLKRRKS